MSEVFVLSVIFVAPAWWVALWMVSRWWGSKFPD